MTKRSSAATFLFQLSPFGKSSHHPGAIKAWLHVCVPNQGLSFSFRKHLSPRRAEDRLVRIESEIPLLYNVRHKTARSRFGAGVSSRIVELAQGGGAEYQ